MAKIFLVCLMATCFYFQSVLGDIGGRGQCSTVAGAANSATSSRLPTSDGVISANCAKLTNTAAAQACAASLSRPNLVVASPLVGAAGTPPIVLTAGSTVKVFSGAACLPATTTLPEAITSGAAVPTNAVATLVAAALTFTIPGAPADFLLDLELVSTSDPLANQNYLQATTAPLTLGTNAQTYPASTVLQRAYPPVAANQIYSAILINRNTGAASLPQYFQVNFRGCTTAIVGPSSFSICGATAVQQIPSGTFAILDTAACATYTFTPAAASPAACPTAAQLAGAGITAPTSVLNGGGIITVGVGVVVAVAASCTYTISCTTQLGGYTVTPKTFTVNYLATCPVTVPATAANTPFNQAC